MEKIEKTSVLVVRTGCGDSYYSSYSLSWEEIPLLETQEDKERAEKEYWKANEYWGESLYFLDAIKIDGKIFIDIQSLLGDQA